MIEREMIDEREKERERGMKKFSMGLWKTRNTRNTGAKLCL